LQVLNTDDCEELRWGEQTPPEMARADNLDYTYTTIAASLEEICELISLTKLYIFEAENSPMQLPHNICALTKLQILKLNLNIKTLPAEMPYYFIQLRKLHLWSVSVKSLPRSFTSCGAFPALVKIKIFCCMSFVEFPEVDEGALPKLKTLHFTENRELETLPLSLGNLTSLRELILEECEDELIDSCMTNCKMSSTWRAFNIQCFGSTVPVDFHFPHVEQWEKSGSLEKKMRYV
jgi:Leucine-rich repeat (LRR) protein